MKKKTMKWIGIFLMAGLMTSCELFGDEGKRYQLDELEQLEQEIIALSESVSCTSSEEWSFTPMGSKACGGPTRYIAYHQSIETSFLNLVEQYTDLQRVYNEKYNIVSDCMLVVAPRLVTCEGGKPVFVY